MPTADASGHDRNGHESRRRSSTPTGPCPRFGGYPCTPRVGTVEADDDGRPTAGPWRAGMGTADWRSRRVSPTTRAASWRWRCCPPSRQEPAQRCGRPVAGPGPARRGGRGACCIPSPATRTAPAGGATSSSISRPRRRSCARRRWHAASSTSSGPAATPRTSSPSISASVPPNTQLLRISASGGHDAEAVDGVGLRQRVPRVPSRAHRVAPLEQTSRIEELIDARTEERKAAILQLAGVSRTSAERPIVEHQVEELTVQIGSLRAQLVTAEAEPAMQARWSARGGSARRAGCPIRPSPADSREASY